MAFLLPIGKYPVISSSPPKHGHRRMSEAEQLLRKGRSATVSCPLPPPKKPQARRQHSKSLCLDPHHLQPSTSAARPSSSVDSLKPTTQELPVFDKKSKSTKRRTTSESSTSSKSSSVWSLKIFRHRSSTDNSSKSVH